MVCFGHTVSVVSVKVDSLITMVDGSLPLSTFCSNVVGCTVDFKSVSDSSSVCDFTEVSVSVVESEETNC